jgi:dipeptidyl aminopeptidase/acylaminoacyl peptidase
MRTLLALALLIPALALAERREAGQLVFDGVPPTSPETAERLNQYLNTRSASLVDWSDQGEALITTRFGDTLQLHTVSGAGAYRRQITFFDEPVKSGSFDHRPGAKSVVFPRDTGGGEFYQFYRMDLGTGRTVLLTDGKSRNESLEYNRKGDRIAYVSTRRNAKDFDLYVQDPADPASAKLVKQLEGQWQVWSWSPDDSRLLLQHYISINESTVHVLDLASGELKQLNEKPGKAIAYGAGAFDGPDSVLLTSDEDSEFLRLVRFNLKTGKVDAVLTSAPWDVSGVYVSRDFKSAAYTLNEGGASALFLGDTKRLQSAKRVKLPAMGTISSVLFDRGSRRLGFSFSGGDATEDLFVVDVKGGTPVRWTFSETGGLNPKTFAAPQLVEFPSFDGRKIPAWYYAAKGTQGPAPVIINIHGGPEAQSLASFSGLAQYFVNELHAAVIYPNVRGSAGYGKSYLRLDNAEKREDSVKDIGALLDWIATRPELDKTRVAVIGGSYGGFMTLASLVKYSDRLRCGVDIVGISHFVTFLEKTEAYRRDLRRAEYGDERDPKMRAILESISPLTNAKAIRKPLFVVQGLNDPRVPVGEAEQIVKTVREQGGEVWYLLAKDEGHGFQKKRNRDAMWQAVSAFFEQTLLK